MTRPRQATLIGGHGFIGRHLHRRLRAEGWACWVPERDDARLMHRDLGHVFYCAGLTADYAERPFDTVEAHVALLNRVLRAAHFDSLVYLSSTRLYDSLGDVCATEDAPLALAPANPRHLYDLSKALGESLCHAAGRGRARVARLSCVYAGASDDGGFLSELMRRVLACRAAAPPWRIDVESSPLFARDYVHIDDVLGALTLIATRGTQTVYNVAGGKNIVNRELFERLFEASGCEVVASHRHEAPRPPRISIQRMAAEFAWQPACVLERLCQTTLEPSPC